MLETKKRTSVSPYRRLVTRMTGKSATALFTLAFALTGGVALLLSTKAATPLITPDPSHHATCQQVTPSKTVVRPGERFTGVVRFYNSGSSTYSPNFGVGLSEYRESGSIWSPSGTDLPGNIPPGGTVQFNLTLTAPTTPGVYPFDWGILIVFNGFIPEPCYGPAITVTNPPSVTLLANSANSDISLTKGAGLTLGWSASNNPSICTASGSWGGGKPASGSENRTADTATAGVKTYTITCSNGAGSSAATRKVTVNNPPQPPSGGGGSGSSGGSSGSAGSTGSSSGSNRGTGTAGRGGGAPSSGSSAPSVSAPPATPSEFSSSNKDKSTVRLTWKNPSYSPGLSGYELERSLDQKNWDKIGKDNTPEESYDDTTVDFGTTYYYRLRVTGTNDLKSEYATSQITTELFQANTDSDQTTLTSDDQKVTVTIPKNAFDSEANCSLRINNDVLSPTKDKYETVTGPYEVLCKISDGTIVTRFKQPVIVTVNVKKQPYSAYSFYTLANDWQEIPTKPIKSEARLDLTDQTTFVLLGKKGNTSIIVKILIGLIVLMAIGVGILYALRWLAVKREQQQIASMQEDYFRKEHGIDNEIR